MKHIFYPNVIMVSIVLCSFFLSGCVSDVANRYYSNETYPAKKIDEVELLFEKPKRPFIVIADFQSRGESFESLRKKAAKIGADAIIVVALGGKYSLSEEWAKNDRYKNKYHSHVAGTAIKYTKE